MRSVISGAPPARDTTLLREGMIQIMGLFTVLQEHRYHDAHVLRMSRFDAVGFAWRMLRRLWKQ